MTPSRSDLILVERFNRAKQAERAHARMTVLTARTLLVLLGATAAALCYLERIAY